MHPPDAPSSGATLLDAMLEDMLERRYLVVDGQGRISRWSAGAERLLGWREEEVVGRSAFAQPLAWAGEGVDLWKIYFAAPQKARPPTRANVIMLCRGGWGLSVEMIAVPVPLVLGYEFTMLVADLAVGGPGSQSAEQLAQVHPLASDAIVAALRDNADAIDSVAGLLVAFRGVAEAAALEDPDAEHAARALAIERDDTPYDVAGDLSATDESTAEDLIEAQASLQAASAEVTRLREEIGRLRAELGVRDRSAEEARTEAGRLSAALDQANSEARAALESLAVERDTVQEELDAVLAERDELIAERDRLQSALDAALGERDGATEALKAATAEHDRLKIALDEATARREELAAEFDRLKVSLEDATAGREELSAECDRLKSALDEATSGREELAADFDRLKSALEEATAGRDELAAEFDRLKSALKEATAGRESAAEGHDRLKAEYDRLRAALDQAVAERDELRRELDHARSALGDATRERETVGAVASETEREREALRTELERAARRCEELSAALDAKTAELQALPGRDVLDSAKRDRDEARAALAAALAERDRAAGALDDAAGERDSADAALRQAEAERDEARAALAAMASESEAARASVAEHEARAEELRRRLEDAERAAAERAADVEAATREAAEQRERVAAGHLETEALAHERARVSELEAQIAALTGELEGALARAAEHAPAVPVKKYAPPRPFQSGLDDAGAPRAHIGLDGRFMALNEDFSELVGYSEAEFSTAYWPPVVDADHRNELRRATARVIAGEVASWDVDTVYMAGSGSLVPVVGTIRLARDSSGAATHLVLDAEPLSAVSA